MIKVKTQFNFAKRPFLLNRIPSKIRTFKKRLKDVKILFANDDNGDECCDDNDNVDDDDFLHDSFCQPSLS